MEIKELYKYYLNYNNIVLNSKIIKQNDIFFGIKGKNYEGSTFAEESINKGAILAIVDNKKYENTKKNIFYIQNGLMMLAIHHRIYLNIPIIVITGSNGKTTTKELCAAVMKRKFKVQYTKNNFNNQIGVLLTILSIRKYHDIAIIEIGASYPQEIKFLTNICKPTIGYITNFGKSHLKGFKNIQGVIKSKSELYDFLRENNKVVLLNTDDPKQVEQSKQIKKITFGQNSNYNFLLFNKNNKVGLKYYNYNILSKLIGNYNFSNISAAIRLGIYFEISFYEIKIAIESYIPKNYRSQIVHKNNKNIILDCYNANPSSMEASIKNFFNFIGSKCLILGDMLELGLVSRQEHKKIIKYSKKFLYDEYFFIGNEFFNVKINHLEFFFSKKDFIKKIKNYKIKSKNILIKGSRSMELETLIDFL